MSAFTRAALREIRPEERILRCSAFRRRTLKPNNKNPHPVTCEKPALHGQGCLVKPAERLQAQGNGDPRGFIRILKREAVRHAGRSSSGKWYFWETW
jgi:hypothetical protein